MSEEAKQQRFQIQRIYVKDISLETPNSPQIFQSQQNWKPEVNLQLQTNTQRLSDTQHEVVLTLTVTAKQGDNTAFLIEMQQAAVFAIENFSDQQLGPMLGAYCPNVLFPYARETIDSLLLKAGFPPLALAPVNFEALYAQRAQQARQQQQQGTDNAAASDATAGDATAGDAQARASQN